MQYRALAGKASDAFYKLSNTRTQIQAYVFDGITRKKSLNWLLYVIICFIVYMFDFDLCDCLVIRASVPKMNLDDVFEQKNDIAKAVEDELEKVKS